ncbi:hypothetical protein GOP47_0014415 [Adiantum capillus-veneris]|uniref:Uncharacterized protein n=1 Tax=Adiantum capillus-veneris TaxID=13818 RepID=A0A9D4ZDH1_ADICA|nr:hypothetical protein GOP47_0031199 [Adiantum capillus-veneris]KAI5070072.1 hypothetical protein GOP47_0014415 [Adiantum capillus-veneris]
MTTLPAPENEAPLDASAIFSDSPVVSSPKKILELEALKVDSKKQRPLVHSPEALKPPKIEEKQDLEAKSSQEEHARVPLCTPHMQALKSAAEIEALSKKQGPLSEPLEFQASLEIDNLVERIEDSGAASTGNLLKAFPDHKSGATPGAPFEIVKEAVALFGERMDRKSHTQVLEEKMGASGCDISKASKEMLHLKEKLVIEEASIVDVLHELEKTNGQIRVCKGEVPVTSVGEGSSSPPTSQPQEVSNESLAKEFHMDVLREVELAEKEIEIVRERRAQLESLKQSSLRECEEALSAEDDASMRVQKLVKEHDSIQESLTVLKSALAETEADITTLRSIPKPKLGGKSGVEPVQMSCTRMAKLESLDLTDADTSMEILIGDLSTIRGVQMSKSECRLLGAKARLDRAKVAEGNHVAALGKVLEQMDEAKLNLKKAINERASFTTTIGTLQTEVSKRQTELESAHETEQIACATLASLQDELCNVRAKVLLAQAGETKAREAKRSLPAAIKQLALDADEAKAASNLAREEARKGRLEIEQAKAGLNSMSSGLQAAVKEGEAFRASEAMALAWLKALSEPGTEPGQKITISISFEEYCALHEAGLEAEDAAGKKVGSFFVEVDAATVKQQEAQGKLDDTLKELAVLLKALEEAQKKADEAQAAKLAVEAELRKWRAEHEQWRKTGSNPSSVSTSAAQSPRVTTGKSSQGRLVSQSFHGKAVPSLDSLAEVFTLKVPASEKAAKVMAEMEFPKKAGKAKKLSFFARVMSLIVRKRSKTAR